MLESIQEIWPFYFLGGVIIVVTFSGVSLFVAFIFKSKIRKRFTYFSLIVSIIFITICFHITYSKYKRLRNILKNDQYKIAVGPVENFDSRRYNGYNKVSFVVNLVKFEDRGFDVTNASNQPKFHGIPIDENSYVKIYYTRDMGKNYILKLWIRD